MYNEAITLLAHMIPAEVTTVVSTPTNYVTLAGHVVEITPDNNYTIVDSTVSAGIIESDVLTFNGFINILDEVAIIPESARPFNISTVRTFGVPFCCLLLLDVLCHRITTVHGILLTHGIDCQHSVL